MQKFHDITDINAKKYLTGSNFIDYRTQPRAYKSYPSFFLSFNLDDFEELKFIKNIGKITASKTYGNVKVDLRANPSAGGLYPCEIYIQLRGIKSLVNGIYHYEAIENKITLIHELSNDGVEYYFEDKFQKKIIFLISNAYFRSAWKYEKRAIRYILLDTGHLLGSIFAALELENLPFNIDFNFDKNSLNEDFSFDKFESFYTSVFTQIHKELECKKLRTPIVNVSACDYQLKEDFIEEFYIEAKKDSFPVVSNIDLLKDLKKEDLQEAVNNRRSIRAFKKDEISKDDFLFITKNIFEFAQKYEIEIYFINNNIKDMKKGLYKNVDLQKEGDFKDIASKLALNQKLSGDSAITLFFTAKNSEEYFYLYILTGFISQILYLRSTHLNISCSGLGAYFDDISKEFLETKNNIFYLFAIGK
jgi:SagB-type dehydrogenase family enzyme